MAYLLHQLLQHSAQADPTKEAVRHKGNALTYGDLDAQSTRLAATLQQGGVVRGDRVGIYLDKSLEAIVAIFGILKAGAVYVPLDSAAPRSRIAFIAENCQMKGIISTDRKMMTLRRDEAEKLTTVQVVIVTGAGEELTFPHVIGWEALANAGDYQPPFPLMEDDLAYIIYTSGSTGTPKG